MVKLHSLYAHINLSVGIMERIRWSWQSHHSENQIWPTYCTFLQCYSLSVSSDLQTADTHKEQILFSNLEVAEFVNVNNVWPKLTETFLFCLESMCFNYIFFTVFAEHLSENYKFTFKTVLVYSKVIFVSLNYREPKSEYVTVFMCLLLYRYFLLLILL